MRHRLYLILLLLLIFVGKGLRDIGDLIIMIAQVLLPQDEGDEQTAVGQQNSMCLCISTSSATDPQRAAVEMPCSTKTL